jgi:hypothetical protein
MHAVDGFSIVFRSGGSDADTHYNVDPVICSTRVLSNQRGCPVELSKGFNPFLIVEI